MTRADKRKTVWVQVVYCPRRIKMGFPATMDVEAVSAIDCLTVLLKELRVRQQGG